MATKHVHLVLIALIVIPAFLTGCGMDADRTVCNSEGDLTQLKCCSDCNRMGDGFGYMSSEGECFCRDRIALSDEYMRYKLW